MLKLDKRCKVCNLVRQDKKLLQRIYDSKTFIAGGESLKAIARDYEGHFEYQSLYNHCRTHQGLSEDDLLDKRVAKVARQVEVAQIKQTIKHTEARDELLEIGMDGVREGEIKLNGNNVVQLLKQKADIEDKSKDRELEIAKMIQGFASGQFMEVIDVESD